MKNKTQENKIAGAQEALKKAIDLLYKATDILAVKDAQNQITLAQHALNKWTIAYFESRVATEAI